MKDLRRILLLGLVLVLAPAQATPVLSGPAADYQIIDFTPIWTMVTEEETPEWAKIPNARAWYELRVGILEANPNGTLMVLRGILLAHGNQLYAIPWIEFLPGWPGNRPPRPDMEDTPEPATAGVVAVALLAAAVVRRRRSPR